MMSQNTVRAAHSQRPIEDVLDFCVELSRRMIYCGANIERVSLAVERICKTYRLTDTSLFLLSTNIILSARDRSGFYASRQLTIPPAVINLTKLSSLNKLCYTVVSAKPSPKKLMMLLDRNSGTKDYSDRIVLLVFTPVMPRLIYMTVSAFAASLYAEFLATLQKKPSTYYVYPAIIPLIPGDLFFFTLLGIYIGNKEMVMENGYNCVFSLASMSFGFVLSFVVAHYIRKFKMKMKW